MFRTHWLLGLGGLWLGLFGIMESPQAHGSMAWPPSRGYYCRFQDDVENPQDPACAAAIAVNGTAPFYDWDGILVDDADSQHMAVVPDGALCSAGRAFHAGLDLVRNDWHTTVLSDAALSGFQFQHHASIPHASQAMLFYMTRAEWTPQDGLSWADLELFCQHGNVPLETIDSGVDGYRMDCDIPNRPGPQVIFHVWQRAGNPTAFYGCIDIEIQSVAEPVFGSGFESP